MQLKTILNRVQKHQSFIYTDIQLKYVCSDMWKPYLKVIVKKASQAIHILDRSHIVAHMNKAIDKVRAAEAHHLSSATP